MPNLGGVRTLAHMAVRSSVLQALMQADLLPKTLTQLRNLYGLNDVQLAGLVGMSRQTLANKLKGATPITAKELFGFSDVFGVPVDVLRTGPAASMRWLLDNPEIFADLQERNSHCSSEFAGAA